jgi:hypothetical protein
MGLIVLTREKIESQFSNAIFSFIFPGMDSTDDQLDFNFAADDLLEFPRDLGEEGWFQFVSEQKLAFLRIEEKFSVALNKQVRLRLRGWDEEVEGKLVLDSLLLPPPQAETISLRLGHITFENTDIEYCHTLG